MSRYVISNGNPVRFPGSAVFLTSHDLCTYLLLPWFPPAREGGPLTLALRAGLRSGHNPQGGAKRTEPVPQRQG